MPICVKCEKSLLKLIKKMASMTDKSHLSGRLAIILGSIILAVSFLNLIIIIRSGSIIDDIVRKNKEIKRPAKINVIIIKDDNCKYCYDIGKLLNEIETENIAIESKENLDYRSEEAKVLISKYNIEKAPSMIIQGEIYKNDSIFNKLKNMGDVANDVVVNREPQMPYANVRTGRIIGSVKVILLSAGDCTECYNYEKYIAELKLLGIPTSDKEVIDYKSEGGRSIVKENSIENVPTFILSGDLDQYSALKKIQEFDDNVFILRRVIRPYLNLTDGKVH